MAFNPVTATPAATLSLFQIIFSIVYVQLAPQIKRFFQNGGRRELVGSRPSSSASLTVLS